MERWTLLKQYLAVWIAVMFLPLPVCAQEKIEYYAKPTLPFPGKEVRGYVTDFADTLADDTLYQVRAENGYPVSYHRKIRTAVCFDNKCRLLNVIVHWNPTGRYLGFELPPGEYLSKAEHDPFTHEEYIRLHSLLQDPNLPLGSFSYNELVPARPDSPVDVDAVSSPTAKNLLEFVVEGAAYTTYKLWHIIHGVTRDEIDKHTAALLSVDLLLEILASSNLSDKIWALNHRHHLAEPAPEVQEIVLSFVASDEFSLAERAIQSIGEADMDTESFQLHLLRKLDDANYSLKKTIIEKFGEARIIGRPVAIALADKLMYVSGDLVGTILRIFAEKNVDDLEICGRVSRLLANDNVFISRQAYEFLDAVRPEDPKIVEQLRQYRVRHNRK